MDCLIVCERSHFSPTPGAARRPREAETDTRLDGGRTERNSRGTLQARLPAHPRRPDDPSLGTEAWAETPAVAGSTVCTAHLADSDGQEAAPCSERPLGCLAGHRGRNIVTEQSLPALSKLICQLQVSGSGRDRS